MHLSEDRKTNLFLNIQWVSNLVNMDRSNRNSVLEALKKVVSVFPEDKQDEIMSNFMMNYDDMVEREIFEQPRRSLNGARSDLYYWHDTSMTVESQMNPFMGFAMLYFQSNWIYNWVNTFYDENGDMCTVFKPIVN